MIVHYLPSNPNFIPFFFMGFTIALGFSFWGSAKQGCLTGALYIYVFGAWFFTCLIFVFSQSSGQEFFFFGILTYHIKTIFSWISIAFFWILDKNREWEQAEERKKWEKEQAQSHQHQQQDRAEQMRREQERREREARQYREQQEQNHQKEKQQEPFKRTPYEILGIPEGASIGEIERAFKIESNRTHPDKWIHKPEHIKKIMEEEYRQVVEAYRILKPKPPPTKDDRAM